MEDGVPWKSKGQRLSEIWAGMTSNPSASFCYAELAFSLKTAVEPSRDPREPREEKKQTSVLVDGSPFTRQGNGRFSRTVCPLVYFACFAVSIAGFRFS